MVIEKKIELLFNMSASYLKNDEQSILQSICDHIEYRLARTKWNFDNKVAYQATSLSVRDRIIELWNDTNTTFHDENPNDYTIFQLSF